MFEQEKKAKSKWLGFFFFLIFGSGVLCLFFVCLFLAEREFGLRYVLSGEESESKT